MGQDAHTTNRGLNLNKQCMKLFEIDPYRNAAPDSDMLRFSWWNIWYHRKKTIASFLHKKGVVSHMSPDPS